MSAKESGCPCAGRVTCWVFQGATYHYHPQISPEESALTECIAALATPGDPVSLSDKIENLLTDDKLRKKLYSNASMDVQEYDYLTIANQHSDLYAKLCHIN